MKIFNIVTKKYTFLTRRTQPIDGSLPAFLPGDAYGAGFAGQQAMLNLLFFVDRKYLFPAPAGRMAL